MPPDLVRACDPPEVIEAMRDFGGAVQAFFEHLHPHWRERLAWAPAEAGTASLPALTLIAFRRVCGPVPRVVTLGHPVSQWCLLPPAELVRRLAVLALSRRPGLVRGCLRLADRKALAAVAGRAIEPLRQLSEGAPLAAEQPPALASEPLAWLGYRDLTHDGAWPDRSLRRWVRLALPVTPHRAARAVPGRLPLPVEIERIGAWCVGAEAAG